MDLVYSISKYNGEAREKGGRWSIYFNISPSLPYPNEEG